LILYLDTSALVKLYAQEEGSEIVRHAVTQSRLVAGSLICYAEARSAFARKARSGDITATALKKYKQEFERDWERIHQLAVDEALVRKAAELCERHGLRATDALHLATADILQASVRATVTFACFDRGLRSAAEAYGLTALR